MAFSDHITTLREGPPEKRRPAVRALAGDSTNRDAILDCMADLLAEQTDVFYNGPTPANEEQGGGDRHEELVRATVIQQAAAQTVLGILGPAKLLDDDRFRRLIDSRGILDRLGRWGSHIACMREQAERAARRFREKHADAAVQRVKIFGLGGSGAPHDMAAEIIANARWSSAEIEVIHADRPNADYIDGATLVLLASFSGNTEETLHCYETIKAKTPLVAVVTRNGKLREIAAANDVPLMQLPEQADHPAAVMEPRESVCLQMTASLAFLAGVGLPAGSGGRLTVESLDFPAVCECLDTWRSRFGPEAPFRENRAKQAAFFLLFGFAHDESTSNTPFEPWDKKIPFVLADRNLRALAHEVRTQFHERAKLNATCYDAPEFLHNQVEAIRAETRSSAAGLDDDRWVYYFVRSIDEQPRIRFRLDKTIELIFRAKAKYAVLNAQGATVYQRSLFTTFFNAHMTTYMALLAGYDPLPVPTMGWIKNVMGAYPRGGEVEAAAGTSPRDVLELS